MKGRKRNVCFPESASLAMKRRRGFTLLELVLVVSLLGILSVSAVAIMPGLTSYRLNGAARKIVSDLRYAQELAMDTHGTYSICFSVAGNWYALSAKDSTSEAGTDPFSGDSYIVQLNQDPYAGVFLSSSDWTGANLLSFNPRGEPSSAGQIRIVSGGKTRTITVVAETGLVRLE